LKGDATGVRSLTGTLSGARVMVVEDDPDTLDTLLMLLEAHGAKVCGVLGSADALRKLASFQPDLVLSDIAMPGEDGFALVARIRRRTPAEGGRVPVLALSAHVYPEDHQRAYAAGFQGFLNKPVTADALLRAVRAALDSAHPVERRRVERRSFVIGEAVPERRVHRRR
jgi:CheY-like chemotaxis protein